LDEALGKQTPASSIATLIAQAGELGLKKEKVETTLVNQHGQT